MIATSTTLRKAKGQGIWSETTFPLLRVIRNIASILTSDVVDRIATFLLYALVARYLGAFQFGQLSIALTLLSTFQVLASAGIRTVVTREISKNRSATTKYFLSASALVTVGSLLSIAAIWAFADLMRYPRDTRFLVVLLSVSLLPYALSNVCEAVFQAWERMQYIALANVPSNIIKLALCFAALRGGRGLTWVILILLAQQAAVLLSEWILLVHHHMIQPDPSQVEWHFARNLLRSSNTFLLIDGIIALTSALNVVLLAKLVGEVETGIYNAATQVMVPVLLLNRSITRGIFPMMCRGFAAGSDQLKRISESALELLLLIAIPCAVFLFFDSDRVLLFLYNNKHLAEASTPVRILAWGLIFLAMTNVFGPVLMAGLRERTALRVFVVNFFVALGLGIFLIRLYGVNGAAIATLLTRFVNFLQLYEPVLNIFSIQALARAAWKPILGGLCMALYLRFAKADSLFIAFFAASIVYVTAVLVFNAWSGRGLRQLTPTVTDPTGM